MPLPLILLGIAKAIGIGSTVSKAATGVAVAAKGAALAGLRIKATAVGAIMVVKGVTMTQAAGVTLLTVATVASGALGKTEEVLEKSGYRTETRQERAEIRAEIGRAIDNKGRHTVRYCEKPDGTRQLVPETYRFCPADGSPPKRGEVFDYAPVR